MHFRGEIPTRYTRFPASALSAWTIAVNENKALPLSEKRIFTESWMPVSKYFIHCQLAPPHLIIPQQTTRFHPGWVVGQMNVTRPRFHAWIERYKLLLPRETTSPRGEQGIGNQKIQELMETYFPSQLAELRSIGKRLPFESRTKVGIEAFNDPDVVTFCEETRKWGFYEVKNESEIRARKVHTNQAASLGLLKDFFHDFADVALIVNVCEGRSLPQVPVELRTYDFTLYS
jgi:hypothetical protein